MTTLYSLPSPSWSGFSLGPLTIHAYALCIMVGIIVAWTMTSRRMAERGVEREPFENVGFVAVICGILGARVYHVLTDHQLYFGPGRQAIDALKIWNGGLGIWGAVAGGALGAWLMCRRQGVAFTKLMDSIAPGLLLAQAIGRLGNWFNQELFGRPTSQPWGLEISPQNRPAGYEQFATFHPTFAYELVWNAAGAAVLLWLERRFKIGAGRLFAAYIVIYCTGRMWIEALRIDSVNHVGGFRLNQYTSLVVWLFGIVLFVWMTLRLRRQGTVEDADVDADDPTDDELDAAELG